MGGSAWSGPATAAGKPGAATGPSIRRAAWWRGRWSGAGKGRGRRRALAGAHGRFRQGQPLRLSPEQRQRMEQLSADIPRLWRAPTTAVADRQAILRHLADGAVADVRGGSAYTGVAIRRQGGLTSRHEIRRAVRGSKDLRDHGRLLARVVALWRGRFTPAAIAIRLNEEGFLRPRLRCPFDRASVRELRARQGYGPDARSARQLGKDGWWPEGLAAKTRVPPRKLGWWAEKGWVHYRQAPMRRWRVLWAGRDEVKRLAKLGARSRRGCRGHPAELTTPGKGKGKQNERRVAGESRRVVRTPKRGGDQLNRTSQRPCGPRICPSNNGGAMSATSSSARSTAASSPR
jgi:hypothetical protein